jgi:hypothetical protein
MNGQRRPCRNERFATDFKGEFHTDYDSLNSLKRKVHALDKSPPSWWSPRGEELARVAHYPAIAASSEWANEILALDQLVIEGFRAKELRNLAGTLGRSTDPAWGSLKLIEECLVGAGVDHEDAGRILDPLRTLHELRTVVKGHAAPEKRRELEKQASTAYAGPAVTDLLGGQIQVIVRTSPDPRRDH